MNSLQRLSIPIRHFTLPFIIVASITTLHSEENLRANSLWPDGMRLTHPEHFVPASVVNVARDDILKLRAGPGTRFVALTDIPANATDLTAFDQDQVWDGDTWWCPVDWEGYRGYVGRAHLAQGLANGPLAVQDLRAASNPQVEQPPDIRPSDRSLRGRVALRTAEGDRQSDRNDPYPWKVGIVTTIFWVGERPGGHNPVPNHMSAWDKHRVANYGGYDSPEPAARRHYIPVRFVPRKNPFYVALPYNDVVGHHTKREAAWVVPWSRETFVRDGQSNPESDSSGILARPPRWR